MKSFALPVQASLILISIAYGWDIKLSAQTAESDAQARQDAIVVRAIERMSGFDYRSNPAVAESLLRQIDRSQGTPEYIKLVKRFKPTGIESQLMGALTGKDQSTAVEAAELLLELDEGRKQVRQLLASSEPAASSEQASRAIEALGLLGNKRAIQFLADLVSDPERSYEHRRNAVAGMTRNKEGQNRLVEMATNKTLVADSFLIAGALLARSQDQAVRSAAAKVLPQPAQKDDQPLAPIDELAAMTGDPVAGMKLFREIGTCANCHIVNDYGKDVGPNLSEIGTKLSREAMLTAVLAPSAGISHNYENYNVLTEEGQVITGLKISETGDEIVIRTADAINRRIPTKDVVTVKKSDTSIMPENLHHLTGQQGLIDVIEYMMTLKKKG